MSWLFFWLPTQKSTEIKPTVFKRNIYPSRKPRIYYHHYLFSLWSLTLSVDGVSEMITSMLASMSYEAVYFQAFLWQAKSLEDGIFFLHSPEKLSFNSLAENQHVYEKKSNFHNLCRPFPLSVIWMPNSFILPSKCSKFNTEISFSREEHRNRKSKISVFPYHRGKLQFSSLQHILCHPHTLLCLCEPGHLTLSLVWQISVGLLRDVWGDQN